MSFKNKYKFWSDDLSVLFVDNKYLEFVPTAKMTRTEQLNAITRFCLYFGIFAYICKFDDNYIITPIFIIIMTYLVYTFILSDSDEKLKEINRMKEIDSNNEKFVVSSNNYNNVNTNNTTEPNKSNCQDNPISIEAGIYDETDKLIIDAYQCAKCDKNNKYKCDKHRKKNKTEPKYSFDDIEEYTKATCRRPSESNPFMNPTVNDFGEVMPQPCNIDDDDIQDEIYTNFNKDLFTEVSDLFERNNSQRQFYSVPGSNVPDTIGFANWLYSPESTCKVDQSKCSKFEDLRYNR